MAIKKGAFEVYAQERQLPNKDIKSKQLKSPFFENPDNGSQTVHIKTDKTEPTPVDSSTNNGSQTVHKRFTDIEITTLKHREKQEASPFNQEQNNGSQTVHIKTDKTESDQVIKFSKLGGIQRDVIIAFYKCIQLNDLYTTKELTLDEISILAGVNKKSLKNTLFRLASTGYIIRAEQKIGRGGWVKYSLNSCLSEELNNIGVVYGLKKR